MALLGGLDLAYVAGMTIRNLVLVLGDQLDDESAAFDGFDASQDRVWMAEVDAEIGRSHKKRIVFFLSAMRHFADELRERDWTVEYRRLSEAPDFRTALAEDIDRLNPKKLVVVLPGDHRVLEELRTVAKEHQRVLEVRRDRHFYTTPEEFDAWADGKKELVLEFFYRKMRKDLGVLMEGTKPEGGQWNFDQDNRASFGKDGPPDDYEPHPQFSADAITSEVMEEVEARYPDNPGWCEGQLLPVTRAGARAHLDWFLEHGLPDFGKYQDAMAKGDVVLHHSRFSALLNVKLLDPRACVDGAVGALRRGAAPMNSVEGFVRQILGWREFIRGIYWRFMPNYADKNALGCRREDVPQFFWDGETDMACVADAMKGLLELGYAHHIHRLMVLGLFAQLADVHPYAFHRWHMDMYIDAVDWVSLPNTLGMSQYGDGGIVGTKPYVATGKYIQRMGPYCKSCRYDPKKAASDDACPFTTLYWDFLARHKETLSDNQRIALQLRNVDRKSDQELAEIQKRARSLKATMTKGARI